MTKNNKLDKNIIIEFITNDKIEIKMLKRNNKYTILVTEQKKKIKERKVFESLDTKNSMDQFFKICNFFTKELK